MDSLFLSAYHTSISIFLICHPWKFAALWTMRKYGPAHIYEYYTHTFKITTR
jgi:hypothetical protein